MDFLKNLKLEDNETTQAGGKPSRERGLFDKLGETIISQTQQHPSAPINTSPKDEGLLGKLADAYHSSTSTPTAQQPSAPVKEDDSLLGKIGKISSALGGEHKPAPTPAAPPREEGLLGKISGALQGSHEPARTPVKEDDSLFGQIGKISSALGGGDHKAATPQDEGLLGKINSVIGGQHQGSQKPQSLGDKINSALGGGAGGEQKEGTVESHLVHVRCLISYSSRRYFG